MRHKQLISALVLATAGCSVSNDDLGALDQGGASEVPDRTVDELSDQSDPTTDGGGYGILIFDTTSSMNTIRSSTGNTRCFDAKVMAQGIINDFFNPLRGDGDGIAIWPFTNNPYASDDVQPTSTGYYTDAASAIAAVNGLTCAGTTPLADAICKGLNGDGETFTINPMLDQMFILTDGFEDNSDGPCSGTSGSIFTAGTWQSKVLAEMVSTGIRVDTRYWVNPTLLLQTKAIDSLVYGGEPIDPPTEEVLIVADVEELPQHKIDQLMADTNNTSVMKVDMDMDLEGICDIACQEWAFFKEMGIQSDGTYGVVADDNADYPLETTTDPPGGPVHPDEPEPLPPVELNEEGF